MTTLYTISNIAKISNVGRIFVAKNITKSNFKKKIVKNMIKWYTDMSEEEIKNYFQKLKKQIASETQKGNKNAYKGL